MLLLSCSVVSHSLFSPHGLQHAGFLAPTISQSLLKLIPIESVISFNHLILCHLLLPSVFPNIRVFSSESVLSLSGQSIRASASASVLPMNIQDSFPLGLTSLISLHNILSYMLVYRASEWPWTVSTRGGSCLLVRFVFPVITGNTPKISQMFFLWS